MHFIRINVRLTVLVVMLTGCAANLSVVPSVLRDQSAPVAAKASLSRIIVLPPRGSERGQVSELAELERVLLARGFRVISSGITGRVAAGPADARVEDATRFSDLERALILAKSSNADALLQVGEIEFQPAERYFTLLEGSGNQLKEVEEPRVGPDTVSVRAKEAKFTFQAKVINVENGEILVSMDISQTTSRVSPAINQTVQVSSSEITVTVDTPQRRKAAVLQVMKALDSHIAVRPGDSTAGPNAPH